MQHLEKRALGAIWGLHGEILGPKLRPNSFFVYFLYILGDCWGPFLRPVNGYGDKKQSPRTFQEGDGDSGQKTKPKIVRN